MTGSARFSRPWNNKSGTDELEVYMAPLEFDEYVSLKMICGLSRDATLSDQVPAEHKHKVS